METKKVTSTQVVEAELIKLGFHCAWQMPVKLASGKQVFTCWNLNGRLLLTQEYSDGIEVYKPMTSSNSMSDLIDAIKSYAE